MDRTVEAEGMSYGTWAKMTATHHNGPPRRGDIRSCSSYEQAKLVPLALLNQLFPDLPELLHHQQARHALHHNKPRA